MCISVTSLTFRASSSQTHAAMLTLFRPSAMLSCPKGLSRCTMALWHLSEVEMRHGVPLSRRSAVRLMSRMSALYGSRVGCIIPAAILQHVHGLWGPFYLSQFSYKNVRRDFLPRESSAYLQRFAFQRLSSFDHMLVEQEVFPGQSFVLPWPLDLFSRG